MNKRPNVSQESSPVGSVQPADTAVCAAERPAVLLAHQQQSQLQ